MAEHLLAIDDVAEDFESILKWAIEFKKMEGWGRNRNEFTPLADLAVGSIYESPAHEQEFHLKLNKQLGVP